MSQVSVALFLVLLPQASQPQPPSRLPRKPPARLSTTAAARVALAAPVAGAPQPQPPAQAVSGWPAAAAVSFALAVTGCGCQGEFASGTGYGGFRKPFLWCIASLADASACLLNPGFHSLMRAGRTATVTGSATRAGTRQRVRSVDEQQP
jgi:hypothetical protein